MGRASVRGGRERGEEGIEVRGVRFLLDLEGHLALGAAVAEIFLEELRRVLDIRDEGRLIPDEALGAGGDQIVAVFEALDRAGLTPDDALEGRAGLGVAARERLARRVHDDVAGLALVERLRPSFGVGRDGRRGAKGENGGEG
jgi:hypothetical protein